MAQVIHNGKYPTTYVLEEGGERFMLGSEVGAFLGFFKGALYKRFPSLYRRIVTSDERKVLCDLNVHRRSLTNMGTMVVKADEAMEIMKGNSDEFRRKDTKQAMENDKSKEAINVAFCRAKSSGTKKLPDLRQNLTFLPGAKERAVASAERRKRKQEQLAEEERLPAVLTCGRYDYPCLASTVINTTSALMESPFRSRFSKYIDPTSTSRRKRKKNPAEKSFIEYRRTGLWYVFKYLMFIFYIYFYAYLIKMSEVDLSRIELGGL